MHLGDGSYVLGLILCVSTHSGPQIVYHCNVKTPVAHQDPGIVQNSDEESEIEWSDVDEDLQPPVLQHVQSSGGESYGPTDPPINTDGSGVDEDSTELFGYQSTLLSEMLCPPRAMCNKRFELTIDDNVFLGLPVHINAEGKWRKRSADANFSEEIEEMTGSGVLDENECPLRMFHVIFVLDPPITDTEYVTDEIYHHVLTPFASVLRKEQGAKNYVWEQVKEIYRCKEENKDLDSVELAVALDVLCEQVAKLGIAHVQIAGKSRAFQVPVETEITHVPMLMPIDSHFAGSYPTTAKLASKEIGEKCTDSYGLLLLHEPDKILKHLDAGISGPFAMLVHKIRPTMSLDKLAEENNIPIKQMVNLAYSLVYWRCARIIIPLNHRYIYDMSPMAPLHSIFKLSHAFSEIFPMIPPLERLLSALCTGKPQPFANHIPSRDHHHVYMEALAWLMRQNLVVHLQSFAVLFIPRKVKLSVIRDDQEVDKQAQLNELKKQREEILSEDVERGVEVDNYEAQPPAERKRIYDFSTDNTSKDMQRRQLSRRWSALDEIDQLTDGFVLHPTRLSLAEKKWIRKILDGHSPENQAMFYRILKYFNGKDCLEQVALHEHISRAEMRKFLQDFQENVIIYRHW